MKEKEINLLLDKGYENIKGKFAPISILFLDMISIKIRRRKELNGAEIATLQEIARTD